MLTRYEAPARTMVVNCRLTCLKPKHFGRYEMCIVLSLAEACVAIHETSVVGSAFVRRTLRYGVLYVVTLQFLSFSVAGPISMFMRAREIVTMEKSKRRPSPLERWKPRASEAKGWAHRIRRYVSLDVSHASTPPKTIFTQALSASSIGSTFGASSDTYRDDRLGHEVRGIFS